MGGPPAASALGAEAAAGCVLADDDSAGQLAGVGAAPCAFASLWGEGGGIDPYCQYGEFPYCAAGGSDSACGCNCGRNSK